jgi:hypothetical protein
MRTMQEVTKEEFKRFMIDNGAHAVPQQGKQLNHSVNIWMKRGRVFGKSEGDKFWINR